MTLPVDAVLAELIAALSAHGAAVLESPPGSGKTTRVPPAVAEAVEGQVWVLEPRRVAARAAAAFVARTRGEAVGEHVGYAMRLDRRAGPRTRVLYVTEAVLTRRLATGDHRLDGVGAVILDEFHERSVHTDLALAWVRRLRRERPELKLVVMSATLDGERVAAFLGCPRVRAEGRVFPVDVLHAPRKDERPLDVQVSAAVREALDGDGGDVLVFLPGTGEIARAAERLADLDDADVLPLHGDVPGDAQDRALRAGSRRRVVLATNVAETSVTVEGVTTVVDTGLVRLAGHDAWSGLPTLDLVPISRASAAQRAGRAGRLAPGRCVRLYTRGDHDARPAEHPPELRRADLAATVLALGGREVEWLDPPPAGAWRAAEELLRRVGALDDAGRTAIGEAMAALPASPRVARVLVEGAALGVRREAARLATLFGRRDVPDLVEAALGGRGDPREAGAVEALLPGAPRATDPDAALRRALLAGFPDRLGRRDGERIVLAEGGSAACAWGPPAFVVVTEADRVGGRVRARSLTAVPDDWLLDHAEIHEEMRWTGERVEVTEQLRVGALVLDASPGAGDPEAIADLLFRHAEPVLHRAFPDWDRAEALVRRVAFLRRAGVDIPELALPALARAGCRGFRSIGELGSVSLVAVAREALGRAAPLVDRLAPEHVALPGRARAPVRYDADAPYVASRMQDFFGLRETPRVAGDVPLVVHLLAPSQRPVQVTRDLAGFWERHYPGIRKELMRRYPRHAWPEDPRVASGKD